jgi:predicted dehydrogenase
MMTTKRGALIGCGFFARNHMNAWAGIEGATIVAVCDRDRAKAEAMARDFGIAEVYDDAQAMLAAEDVDFLDIATTPQTHRHLVELACRHGKATICQKPFAETMADAQAMVAAADEAGVPLVVHENFRWQEPFLRMRAMLEAGRIGKPHFARFSFRHGYDNYKNQPYLAEIERFTLMDVGPHLYDLARLFLGEVATIACRTQNLNPIVRGEDAFTALLGHENGAVSVVDCSFYSKIDPEPFPQTIAWIEGDAGTLTLDEGYRLTLHGAGGRESVDVEPGVPAWGEKPWHAIQDSVVQFQRHVVDVLHGRAEPQPSGADNLKTLALALASYESAQTGGTIAMREWRERS